MDLTGYTAYMSIAATVGATPIITVSTTASDSGSIIFNLDTGLVSIDIFGSATLNLTGSLYYYDFFLVAPGGRSLMVLSGKLKVNANVTTPIY